MPETPPNLTLDQSLQAMQNGQGAQAVQGLPGLPTMSPEALAKLQAFVQQPALKKYVALVTNPEFTTDLTDVLQHPQGRQCLQFELIWVVAMFVFRSWMMSKSTHWIKNLWTSLWTFVLFWAGAVLAIPSYFLNPAYMKLVKDTIRFLS